MAFILPWGVMSIYMAASFLFWRVYKNKINALAPLLLMVLATQLHGLLLFIEVRRANFIDLSIFKVISLYGWIVALCSLFYFRRGAMALAAVVVCLFNSLLVLLPHIFISSKVFSGQLAPGMLGHILFSLASWTLLTIAFLHALLYSWLFQRLKRKQLRHLQALSLTGLEHAMMRLALLGFVLLSLSLLSGWLFVDDLLGQHLAHKTVLSLLAWLTLAILLYYFYAQKMRGMQLVYGLLAIFALLLTGYVISNIILQFFIFR